MGAAWGQWPKVPSWAPTLLLRGEDSVPVLPRDGPAALLPQWGEPGLGAGAGTTGQGQAGAVLSAKRGPGAHQVPVQQAASPTNPTAISPDEYFDPNFRLESRNIGRPIEMSSKVQR